MFLWTRRMQFQQPCQKCFPKVRTFFYSQSKIEIYNFSTQNVLPDTRCSPDNSAENGWPKVRTKVLMFQKKAKNVSLRL